MSKKEKVVLEGKSVGRVKAGWLLFKEAFRFMWTDKEMLWVPVISGLMNIFLFGIVLVAFFFAASAVSPEFIERYPVGYVLVFLVYVVGAFSLSFSQAAIAHIVYVRAHGGDATLGDGIKKAFSHWWGLLAWSIIASTVGMILRIISERSKLLGKIVTALLGSAWAVLTYFVVPAIVIDNHGPFASIKKSTSVFKKTWGETLVSNISFVGVFIIAHVLVLFSLAGVFILGVVTESSAFLILSTVLLGVWIIVFSLVSSTVGAVIRILLYIYATEGTVPQNFNGELLEKMLVRNNTQINQVPPVQSVPPIPQSVQNTLASIERPAESQTFSQ